MVGSRHFDERRERFQALGILSPSNENIPTVNRVFVFLDVVVGCTILSEHQVCKIDNAN